MRGSYGIEGGVTYLVKSLLETLSGHQGVSVLPKDVEAFIFEQLFIKLDSFSFRESSEIMLELELNTSEEWRNGDIRNIRLIATKESAIPGEALLNNLHNALERIPNRSLEHKREKRGQQLASHKIDEEACLGSFDRVGGQQLGLGVEIRNKFDEHDRLGQFH